MKKAVPHSYDNIRRINDGEFNMGSNLHYPEERPVRPKHVHGFWIDITPVTNKQFAQFINDTGYVTTAEKTVIEDFPDADPALLDG
ncbi:MULTISPECIES: SUMF1/EgtB/PvdO family nonheme iron enzyme [Edwardsiella]|uniref:Sulfatase-modifying factor enzyme-like domain-containing protein n=2 Tax=Edwardsiella anguillarum TaxID=1821960 RepID=A0A076LG10_9GAMM|nr:MULTISPECIES: SUMF1/EgtB/PvdO family nonheme iron enzyme [Edwardsiella]AIJ07460.1 Hypothetical protein ETEE_0995 [Edwardsiella anguillarum ET080813]KAB0589068.1 formylglycine-generating enzyme family protein [Edwardsiella anguillarum]UBU94712.1 formylglycine-generating enzyme family protein [Edwardsiella sp. LADL05-105]UOU78543.1 formylglycine-generating enzyme family protein [Edwardsiella anguillarum]WHP83261.1 formylglycine-generating enzyme family protein [Edwardsiella anguillarum]